MRARRAVSLGIVILFCGLIGPLVASGQPVSPSKIRRQLTPELSMEIPADWNIADANTRSEVGKKNQVEANRLGASGTQSIPLFLATYKPRPGADTASAQISVFAMEIPINQEWLSSMRPSEIKELGDDLRRMTIQDMPAIGRRFKDWNDTQKVKIGNKEFLLTEYMFTDRSGRDIVSTYLIYPNGRKSLTIDLHHVGDKAFLTPLLHSMLNSIQ